MKTNPGLGAGCTWDVAGLGGVGAPVVTAIGGGGSGATDIGGSGMDGAVDFGAGEATAFPHPPQKTAPSTKDVPQILQNLGM